MTSESPAAWKVNGPTRGRLLDLQLGELWRHRELAFFFAYRDVRVRYKQAFLGISWAVIQPLAGALTFTILFNQVADIEVETGSYFAFAVAGFVTWNYVAAAISNGTGSLLYSGELVTKVSFPRLVVPVASVIPGVIDLAMGLIVALVVSRSTGGSLTLVGVSLLPLGLVLLIVATAGPVIFFSALTVRYRDVLVLVSFGLQILLFITPIAYPPSILSAGWRTVVFLNPVSGAVGLIRAGVIGDDPPTAAQLALSCSVAGAVFVLGLISFRAREREFADII